MTLSCKYCKKLKRPDQLMETHSGKLICVDCSEEFHMCMSCGSTTKEDYSSHGQAHYESDCV